MAWNWCTDKMRSVFAAVVLVVCTVSISAAAQSSDEQIEEFESHLQRASELFDQQQYSEGIDELQSARGLFDHPRLTEEIGNAYRDWGRCARAEQSYRAVLDREDVDEQRRTGVRESLEGLEDCVELATLRVVCEPADATLSIDQQDAGCPYEEDIPVGTVGLRVEAPGFQPHRRSVEVEPETTNSVTVTLESVDRQWFTPPEWFSYVGYGSLGLGGVLLVGGTISDYGAGTRVEDAERAARQGDVQRLERLSAEADAARVRTLALYVSGAVLSVAGAAILWVETPWESDDANGDVAWSWGVGPAGVTFGAEW